MINIGCFNDGFVAIVKRIFIVDIYFYNGSEEVVIYVIEITQSIFPAECFPAVFEVFKIVSVPYDPEGINLTEPDQNLSF